MNNRNGNVVLEPLPEHATTAEQARTAMAKLEECVPKEAFATKGSVTVRCYRNQLMTREFANELYRLITDVYGVPVARFIGPTADGASYLVDAAATVGKPDSVQLFMHDGPRVYNRPSKSLSDYLAGCN